MSELENAQRQKEKQAAERPTSRVREARSHLKLGGLAGLLLLACAVTSGAATPEADAMLTAHNAWRSQVGTPPLTWSDKLAGVAQEWANHLIETGAYEPREKRQYGENLFDITNGKANPKMVVDAWAGERANYDHDANSCKARCGHYTQVVWRSTKSVGCAVARGKGREVWVCNYDPPGNVIGEKPY